MESTPTDRFVVETPENIRFGYDIADIGSRFLAVLIDSLIQSVLYVILFIGGIIVSAGLNQVDLPEPVSILIAVALFLFVFLIQFGYFIFLEIFMAGQTPGKRLFNLRVVKDNGNPLSPVDSIVRNLVRIVDFFPIAYGIGVIVMFLNRRAKRLGDFAAGTIVVKMRDQVKLNDLRVAPRTTEPVAPLYETGLGRLQEADVAMVESFLLRQTNFTNSDKLALQLAQRMGHKMGRKDAPTTGAAALTFLRDIVNDYRRGRG